MRRIDGEVVLFWGYKSDTCGFVVCLTLIRLGTNYIFDVMNYGEYEAGEISEYIESIYSWKYWTSFLYNMFNVQRTIKTFFCLPAFPQKTNNNFGWMWQPVRIRRTLLNIMSNCQLILLILIADFSNYLRRPKLDIFLVLHPKPRQRFCSTLIILDSGASFAFVSFSYLLISTIMAPTIKLWAKFKN